MNCLRLRITASLSFLAAVLSAFVASIQTGWTEDTPASAEGLIGYTELRADLAGGRHANTSTSRAFVVNLDGSGRRELAPHLAEAADTWTQFAGWSPDGATAIIGSGWQDPENAKWEEENKTFRMEPGRWRYDSWLMDLASGKLTNVSEVDRVSHYNSVSFSADGKKLLMTSLVGGTSKPYLMELDGTSKTDVSGGTDGFTYGFNASPDGKRICYHENYQVYLANADGTDKKHIDTGHSFNFAPTWSPDGNWLLFVSGEHYDCHPHVVRADGTGLRKIADRAGYRGVTEFLDVPDFHGGSSDTPVWSADGQTIFYTAKVASCIELFHVTLDGDRERLTTSPEGTSYYHPKPSPDGKWLLYGSKRDGVRQLVVRDLGSGAERQITKLQKGQAAMWPHWRPRATDTRPIEAWASPRELRDKRLIGTGQYALQDDASGVTPTFLEKHPEFSCNHPFDGAVIVAPLDRGWSAGEGLEAEQTYCLDGLAWTTKAVPYEAVAATIETLKRIQWGPMTDNFLWYRLLDSSDQKFGADLNNDADWVAVQSNAALAARVCREAKLVGFMLDTEQYTRYLPAKGEEAGGPFPFGRDTAEVLRKRGAQWMRAVQAEFPEIVIDIYFAWSPDLDAADFLKGVRPFLDGMLDSIEAPARLVHGYENTFYYGQRAGSRYTKEGFPGGRARYQAARDSMKAWRGLSGAPEKYDAFVEVGMAAWLESDPWNLWSGWPSGTQDSLWSNLPLALAYSKEYVWCWSEHTHYGHTMGDGQLNPFLASITNQTFNTGHEAVVELDEDFVTDPMQRGWYFDFDMLHSDSAPKVTPGQAMATPSTDALPYAWSAEDQAIRIRPAASVGAQRRRFVHPLQPLGANDGFRVELDFRVSSFPAAASAPIVLGLFNSAAPLRRQCLAMQILSAQTVRLIFTTVESEVKEIALTLAKPLALGQDCHLVLSYDPAAHQMTARLLQDGAYLVDHTFTAVEGTIFQLDEIGAALAESALESEATWILQRVALRR
jgi:TolB protein